ncbi:MAG: polyprenyl synthetase family protein [Lutimaribacter sp.]
MLQARMAEVAALVQARLDREIGQYDGVIADAMAYASRGGKRLRALLVVESARLHAVPQHQAEWPAAAIEALHAYSLVHDDLPCMDDDSTRRGQPTVHIKWDQATAVLAGDALQTLAFEMLGSPACHPMGDVRADLCLSLARAAGAGGMVRGQMLDIAAETAAQPLDLAQITELQAGKTGALITWSATVGARMAGADLAPLARYGDALGLAFQVWDDVLDVTGDAAKTGKAVGKDAQAGKATFVSLLGLEAAQTQARTLVDHACDALSGYGYGADCLRQAARFVIARDS